ncbi:MAG TPA: glutamate--tRNA ligase [Candidatus Sulfotelmatobacter sp.]|nr:glutamate--tRNA ligase [Candidatus Sulfotelmatobacter sp.]
MTIRVRIAPSPTGPIHVGNVHTALFNWLWARKVGGQFILRFEDTDRERSKTEWETVIYEDLAWLGMNWDEGPDKGGPYPPYRQMDRLDLYREYAEKLLQSGHVYKCYCTKEEEEEGRKEAQEQNRPYQYKGRCRNLTPEQQAAFEAEGRSYVLRFRVPHGEVVSYDDIVRGLIEFPTDSIGDFIIMRSNGIPLYNFAVVIDDVTMKITHILRGEGHIPNTPVQLLIYKALGLPIPQIGHVGHMTNEDRGKLSKRKGEAAVRDYREQGYLPDALMNFMALLGWTPPGAEAGREILTKEELIADFDITRVTKAPSVFDRAKLNWMNGVYIRNKTVEEFANLALPFVVDAGLIAEEKARADWDWFKAVMTEVQARVQTLAEVPQHVDYFLKDDVEVEEGAAAKFLTDAVKPFFRAVSEGLATVDWNLEAIEEMIRGHMESLGLKPKESIQPIRVAVTGRTASPGLFEVVHLIGRERTIARMKKYC